MALGFHTATPDLALLGPRDRRRAGFSLAVLGVLSLASGFGLVASAYLVNHHPLLLIALSPIGRHLVLVVPKLNPVALILVAGLRRLVFYLACFQLGRALGPSGVAWLEQRAVRFARFVRWIEAWFAKAPRLVVLFFAGPTVSALAGISGMPLATYIGLAVLSLLARLLLLLGFGELLREPIEWLLAWIDVHWVLITVLMVLGLGAFQGWRFLRAKGAQRQRSQST